MAKPLDEPSKLFGLCTYRDMVLIGLLGFLAVLVINKLCLHGLKFPLAVLVSGVIFGPIMSFLILKNHLPSGFFFFLLRYWKKPKLYLPIAERSKIERIKNASN